MSAYDIVKAVHILSATILFGTGLGTAFFFWRAQASRDVVARLAIARAVVLADWCFTAPAVIVQPVSGAWMIMHAGLAWNDRWLVATYCLYVMAGLCWLPVVAIQLAMKTMLENQASGQAIDDARYQRLYRWWFALGWPAFGGLVVVFLLMVAKPSW